MNVKEQVLKALQNPGSGDGFVSGEELAGICGVTRASVWKTIRALREQGATIEAVKNRGYRLASEELYDGASVGILLPPDIPVSYFETLDSTNAQAKRMLFQRNIPGLHKHLVVSNGQTDGRGRFGRSFCSPHGTGVYFSLIYIPSFQCAPGVITASAATALCRAIQKVYAIDAGIKWMNDIVIGNRKVAGILTEGITDLESGVLTAVVIGCGINIAPNAAFDGDLQEIVGTLRSDRTDMRRRQLCAQSVNELVAILDGGTETLGLAVDEYRRRSVVVGQTVTVHPLIPQQGQPYRCFVTGITDDACLEVRLEDGSTAVVSGGEVSVSGFNARIS